MRRKIHLHKKYTNKTYNKKRHLNKIIIIILLVAICLFVSFKYINKKIAPIILSYAEVEAKKLASLVISKAINLEMAESLNVDDLFILERNGNGEIQSIDFDPVIVNQILLKAVNRVQKNLRYLEEGDVDSLDLGTDTLAPYDSEKLKKGIFYEIPLGAVFNNALLSNLGPKIPVRFDLVGDIICNIESKITSYGINNALIEVSINLKLSEKIILPINSGSILVEVNIPIALKIVQGVVPNYYFNNSDKTSTTLTLPIE